MIMKGLRILAAALIGVLVLSACSGGDPDSPDPAATTAGEIFLEPAGDPGDSPFTDDAAVNVGTAPQTPSAAPSEGDTTAVTSVEGTQDGLYAAGDEPACDVDLLIEDLAADPAAAKAWAGVLGLQQPEIESFLRGLAPVVLRYDTRVTNHNFRDGVAVPFQSVLQAGTSVLVDAEGMPVVRCVCGNPLLPPQAQAEGAQYVGDAWPGFEPALVVVVVPGPPVDAIVCVHVDDPERVIQVPVPGGSPTSETSAAPSADPGNTQGDYLSCAQRYGELVRDLTLAGGIDPADASRWAAQAEQAATLAESGDLAGAYEICWQTVGEMEVVLGG